MCSNIDNIKIVDYWKACRSNDPTIIGLSIEDFELLKDEYFMLRDLSQERASLNNGFNHLKKIGACGIIASSIDFLQMLEVADIITDKEAIKNLIFNSLNKLNNSFNLKTDDTIELAIKKCGLILSALNSSSSENQTNNPQSQGGLFQDLVCVEEVLGRSIGDINTVVISQWAEYEKSAKNKKI